MSKKQPALITRYKKLQAELEDVQSMHGALKEELKKKESNIANLEKRLSDRSSEVEKLGQDIESVHQLLDALPNPIGRQTDEPESWSRKTRPIITRLAAWLAASRTH